MQNEIDSFIEKWQSAVKEALEKYIEAEVSALRTGESPEASEKAAKAATARLNEFLTILQAEGFNPPEGFQIVDPWGQEFHGNRLDRLIATSIRITP